jgi:hypothetical protein
MISKRRRTGEPVPSALRSASIVAHPSILGALPPSGAFDDRPQPLPTQTLGAADLRQGLADPTEFSDQSRDHFSAAFASTFCRCTA